MPGHGWTLKKLRLWVERKLGRSVSRSTLRSLLKAAGMSWKKCKKLLARAKPERRAAYVQEFQVWFERMVQGEVTLIYVDEVHIRWRISVTNAPPEELSLSDGVLAYRDQIIAENVFRRLHGKVLSITPLYVQRDDHAKGLFHLLTIGARFLALGDYLAKEALATQKSELTGIYRGNPKRGTARPTTERMLKAFAEINLIIFST